MCHHSQPSVSMLRLIFEHVCAQAASSPSRCASTAQGRWGRSHAVAQVSALDDQELYVCCDIKFAT